jgi:hypothetical protein
LIGPDLDGCQPNEKFGNEGNVRWLGPRDEANLPGYLRYGTAFWRILAYRTGGPFPSGGRVLLSS